MTTHPDVAMRKRHVVGLQRAIRSRVKWARYGHAVTTGAVLVAITLVGLAMAWQPSMIPLSGFAPIAVFAGLFLRSRTLLLTYVYLLAWALFVSSTAKTVTSGLFAAWLILGVILALMYWVSAQRTTLGVQGLRGENMLIDLRDRLKSLGSVPPLPRGWHVQSALESAYGDSFSGDFMLTATTHNGARIEIVLVDVSGKGAQAGTRSLLLSGAFGGLLGSMEPDAFLGAANAYVMRQRWPEGFATAAHVVVDTTTGEFSVASAGHPPAVRFFAGSARWELLDDRWGPLLGVMEKVAFPRTTGVLARGDAILLYTDGVVEARSRDLGVGIDRMLGTAERSGRHGFDGLADRLVAGAVAGETDDRAVVLIWRE